MKLLHSLVLGTTLATAGIAVAQDQHPAVTARQSQFRLFQHHLATLGGMARGTIEYDADLAVSAAANLSRVASQDQMTFWPEGTDTRSIEGTRALPVIWENPDDFMSKLEDLRVATTTIQAVAGTDLESLRGNLKQLTDACGSCHETYRQPE